MTAPTCPDCGHRHRGSDLANICVGCPCQTGRISVDVGLTADQVSALLRYLAINASLGGEGDYREGWDDGSAHALKLVQVLLAAEQQ